MTDDETINRTADAWGALHGLRRNPLHNGQPTLRPLFTSSTEDLVRGAVAAHLGEELLARSRAFKAVGALRDSVLVTAPTERSLLRRVGNPGRIVEEAWALATELSLRVRVGDPRDALDTAPGSPVVPIVFWDPERISLPYPPLGGGGQRQG